jgi:RsiW-degrading membrane proteinase PrsW (M82 family)
MAPELVGKGFLIPAVTTIVFGIAATAAAHNEDFLGLARAFAVYFALVSFYVVYAMCGKKMPWYCFLAVGLFTAGFLTYAHGWLIFGVEASTGLKELRPSEFAKLPFNERLPYLVVRAGMIEEASKIVPVALLACLALWLNSQRARAILARLNQLSWWPRQAQSVLERLSVREPIDGILLAVVSASAFLLLETLGQYGAELGRTAAEREMFELKHSPQIAALLNAIKAGSAPDEYQQHFKLLSALLVQSADRLEALATLVPVFTRTLMAPFAHAAWSGILGYGVGLAVLKPRSALQIIVICYGIAAGLHGLWDAGPATEMGLRNDANAYLFAVAVELASYAILATMILKARQISPTRASNFATTFLRQATFELRVGGHRIPLNLGARLTASDLAQHDPRIAPNAPIAEVTHNPRSPRILGLKNVSPIPWRAMLPDSTTVDIPPGHSVRLVGQCRISFGTVEGIVA